MWQRCCSSSISATLTHIPEVRRAGTAVPDNGDVDLPWWFLWVLLAAAFGPAEAMTRGLYFASGAVGAVAGAVAAAVGEPWWIQAAAFAVFAAAGLAGRRVLLGPYLKAVIKEGRLTGTAIVVEAVGDEAGRVRYGGRKWDARTLGPVIPPGAKVAVAAITGRTSLRVYPKDAPAPVARGRRAAPVVRVTWREASAARGRLTGGYPLTAGEQSRLLKIRESRRRYTDRLFGRFFAGLIGAASVLVLLASVLGLGPALRAARGEGVRGEFTAQTLTCGKICMWTGIFTSDTGQVLTDVSYDDKLSAGTRPGSVVPALYPGGSSEVFAVHDSVAWHLYLVFIPLGVAGLIGSLWLGPIAYLRRKSGKRQSQIPA